MTKSKDPVCGMMVDVNKSTLKHQFKEIDYYFCSGDCLVKFAGSPNSFISEISGHCCREGKGIEHGHHGEHHHGHCQNGHHHHDPKHRCCRSNQE